MINNLYKNKEKLLIFRFKKIKIVFKATSIVLKLKFPWAFESTEKKNILFILMSF